MENNINIDKLKTLGWKPIDPSTLSDSDKGKPLYQLDGNSQGDFLRIHDGNVYFTDNVFKDEYFLTKEYFNEYSLNPPTVEMSLVALGFENFGTFCLSIKKTKVLSKWISVQIEENGFIVTLNTENYNNNKCSSRTSLEKLPNIKSIPELKKCIEMLNFLFVER